MNCVICHYDEIGIKGGNRRFFEKRLTFNIERIFPNVEIEIERGRIIILSEYIDENRLKKIPGIANFSYASKVVPDKMEEEVLKIMLEINFSSFRITVVRSDKSFSQTSQEIAARLGALIVKKTGAKVNLTQPEVTCFIEVTNKGCYIYTKKIKGEGGLPVGSGGKGLSLISGGIDSPVASHAVIRRGMKLSFIHFHAYPVTSAESIEKVERIVSVLCGVQGPSIIYLVPFADIQKEILLKVEDRFRVIAYRRAMIKIAERVALNNNLQALVTGDSLGQVASQTVENMTATGKGLSIPLFRPLVGEDKQSIIKKAKKIGTYQISILPEEDCCSRFLPKHPETKIKLNDLERVEKKIELEKIIENALLKIEKKKIIT